MHTLTIIKPVPIASPAIIHMELLSLLFIILTHPCKSTNIHRIYH